MRSQGKVFLFSMEEKSPNEKTQPLTAPADTPFVISFRKIR